MSGKHSGFCVHRSKRVQPHQKEDLKRLAQYIIRNPSLLKRCISIIIDGNLVALQMTAKSVGAER